MTSIQIDEDGDPLVDQFSEEGFIDLVFRIAECEEEEDRFRLRLRAIRDDQKLGFDCWVFKGIEPFFDEQTEPIPGRSYPAGVTFQRTGAESDRLMSLLTRLYGQEPATDLRMTDAEDFTVVALCSDPFDLRTDYVRCKLFGRSAEGFDEEEYYESFFHVNIAGGFVFWNEKDTDYRVPLLRGMCQSEPSN